MIPVTASTNIDKSKIDLADVDSGEKMFVRPVEAEWAAALAAEQSNNATVRTTTLAIDFWVHRIRTSLALGLVLDQMHVSAQGACLIPIKVTLEFSRWFALCPVNSEKTSRDGRNFV
jgi:hypothetical protein